MKKMLICLGLVLLLSGCHSKPENNETIEQYQSICDELLERSSFDTYDDFKVTLTYNSVEEGYRYDVVIDEPKEKMQNIIAVATTKHSDYGPSVGLFDEEPYHMSQEVDKENNIYKGLLLSGITSEEEPVFIYISYQLENNDRVTKYIEVKNR